MAPVKFTPWEDSWLQDPWPQYRQLRQEDPVHWCEPLGHWVLTRYHDVVQVAKDPRFTATNRPPQRRWMRPTMMVTADPPEHSRLRRPVAHHFGSTAVEALVPRMQEIVDAQLDQAEERGGFDVAWDYARILPRRIISEIMGLPYVPPERPRGPLNAFGMEDTGGEGRPPRPAPAAHEESAPMPASAGMAAGPARRRRQAPSGDEDVETPQDRWFKEAFERHRAEVMDDAVQALLKAEAEGKMTAEEVLDTATILYGAGQETTGSLITNAVYQLLRHPDQLAKLQRQPDLIRSAVDELLRFDAPVHAVRRKAVVDVELGGKTIKAGDKVLLMFMAANHDPEVFADSEEMDLERQENYHIAFGSGPHTCLGGILARAEAQVAIGALVRRFPRLRLAKEDVRYQGSFILRSVRELPVSVA
ncbi:MAG TPA: cytochrome P450 [Dehalococcoidia bacterium]|nr:cytochrome P450 [Dehalococcoidia bacterium]